MKPFILIAILAVSALASTVTLAISPQTGKKLCYVGLPIAVWATLNGLNHLNPIEHYKKIGPLTTCASFLGIPPIYLIGLFYETLCTRKIPYSLFNTNSLTIGGALGAAGSIAGIYYFNNQIKARTSPDKKAQKA